jgi:hypothetical protein
MAGTVNNGDRKRQRTMLTVADDPMTEHRALFVRDGDRYVPTELARGPWDPNALHGGAPSALFAHACEQHDPSSADFLARLTVELLRPVPLAPLRLHVESLRPGKKVHWLSASLFDEEEREVAHATALRVHSEQVDTTGAVSPVVEQPPGVETADAPMFPFGEGAVGYWTANELRLVRGSWMEAGPSTAWIRLRCAVIDGEPNSPFMRVASAADFGSGVGNPVRVTNAVAINPELTVHLHRHPEGEWICLESGGWAQPTGVGLAETRLYDEQGVIGRATQTLLVESITRRPPPGQRR